MLSKKKSLSSTVPPPQEVSRHDTFQFARINVLLF